jgi:uncharacterized membrane protein YphA (DoxX/SURF4 family)
MSIDTRLALSVGVSSVNTHRRVAMWHPHLSIIVLRIAVGLFFLKALWTKMDGVLLAGAVPFLEVHEGWIGIMPKIVGRQAAENPIGWYKAFLDQTVLTHATLFAHLTAWGEVLVGVSLTLGLLSGCGAIGGLLLSVGYGLAAQHLSPASFGLHYMLVATMPVLFLARSGRMFGLDAVIARRWQQSSLTARPWS